jgi:hypothetical protein
MMATPTGIYAGTYRAIAIGAMEPEHRAGVAAALGDELRAGGMKIVPILAAAVAASADQQPAPRRKRRK